MLKIGDKVRIKTHCNDINSPYTVFFRSPDGFCGIKNRFNYEVGVSYHDNDLVLLPTFAVGNKIKTFRGNFGEIVGSFTDNVWWVRLDTYPILTIINEYEMELLPSEEKPTTKCSCGCSKVYGENYPADKHSDYCSLYVKL